MKIKLIMEDNGISNGSYLLDHSDDECDKCLKKVGKENLRPVNFFYMDKNDKIHGDKSPTLGIGTEPGYRHYKVCNSCFIKEGVRMNRNENKNITEEDI